MTDHRTAVQALTEFVAPGVVGFVYTPVSAHWFRVDDAARAVRSDGSPLDFAGVFELRAFDPDRELRWWNESAGAGPARQVTDDTVGGGRRRGDTYRRLLWGTVVSVTAGWATLAEPRIGRLAVPASDAVVGARLWLHAVEYQAEDRYGNVAVVDERLTHLTTEPVSGEQS